MLVEDEPDIQMVAKIALEVVGGFSIEICSSGQETLDKVLSSNPDLILMDVMMPGMDGPTLLTKLRERAASAHFPILFMTAKIQSHEVARYRDMGALGVIPKPFNPMTLAAQVRSFWDEAQAALGRPASATA